MQSRLRIVEPFHDVTSEKHLQQDYPSRVDVPGLGVVKLRLDGWHPRRESIDRLCGATDIRNVVYCSPSLRSIVFVRSCIDVEAERIRTMQVQQSHVVADLEHLDDLGCTHSFTGGKTDTSEVEP